MAKKSKEARSFIKLVSSESDHCYFVQKNRNNTKERLQLRRYDPSLRKHVISREVIPDPSTEVVCPDKDSQVCNLGILARSTIRQLAHVISRPIAFC